MEEKQESKFIKKRKKVIEILRENNLDFNHLFILECFYYEEDREFLNMFTIPSLKDLSLSVSFQVLKKFEYLVEDPNDTSKFILSIKGKELLEKLKLPDEEISLTGVYTGRISLEPTPEEKFEEWWKVYPKSTAWQSDDGVKFIGSRNLRNLTKTEARKRYLKLLNQGLKHEELLGSLKFEIKLKKIDSVKKNENQMDFFKGMESYFNQERYLVFMESYREDPDFVKGEETKIKGKKRNVHDI